MDIFSSLDMLGNFSTDGSAGQGHCEGAHAACLAFFDGRPPSEVREVPSTRELVDIGRVAVAGLRRLMEHGTRQR